MECIWSLCWNLCKLLISKGYYSQHKLSLAIKLFRNVDDITFKHFKNHSNQCSIQKLSQFKVCSSFEKLIGRSFNSLLLFGEQLASDWQIVGCLSLTIIFQIKHYNNITTCKNHISHVAWRCELKFWWLLRTFWSLFLKKMQFELL